MKWMLSGGCAWSSVGYNCSSPGMAAVDTTAEPHMDGLSNAVIVVAAIALSAVIVLSTLGNIMVLYVIFMHLQFRTITNAFITILSISDLSSTIVCMPMTLVTLIEQGWIFGNVGCVINGMLNATVNVLSSIMLAFITIDRYFVVVKLPRKPLAMMSALVAISIAFCLSLSMSAPWYMLVPRNGSFTPYKGGYHHCNYIFHILDSHYPNAVFSSFHIILCYIVPVSCMIFCSVNLWKIIHRNECQIRPVTAPASEIRFNGEMRTAKTVVIMVIMYIATRMPYLIASSVCAILGSPVPPSVDTAFMWLFWLNCAVNPVIYAFRNPTVAQFLRLGRKAGYEAGGTAVPAPAVPSRDTHNEMLSPRQCKYLPTSSPLTRNDTAGTDISAIAGKDDRSDSIPSVLLFRTSYSGIRKGSDFSNITTSTNTTTL